MHIRINMNKHIVITVLLIILISAASVFSMHRINKLVDENCFNTLHQAARDLSHEIETNIENDSDQLSVIADIIAQHDINDDHVQLILSVYKSQSITDHLEILLPDNTVILSDGSTVNADGILSFEKESALGVHISDREKDITNPDNLILRNYVPIKQGGKTIAMLYGVVDLKTLPDKWNVTAYDGNSYLYIIDGANGDYIVDTWHKNLGSLSSVGTRKTKGNQSNDKMIQDVFDGNSGYVTFKSETTGDYLYFYYEPTHINDWRIGISVSESTIFRNARRIRNILYGFAAFEIICFAAYFTLTMTNVRKDSYEKQKRLDMLHYIYTVKKALFTAHHKKENIDLALMRIAAMTTAETAFFIIFDKNSGVESHMWLKDNTDVKVTEEQRNEFMNTCFRKISENTIVKHIESIKDTKPEKYALLKACNIHNYMAVPLMDEDDRIIGVLGVMNIESGSYMIELLENVTLSFAMLYHNIQSFRTIKTMGEMDLLTGLLNRNSFQQNILSYKDCAGFACIYADANGLHELNNTKGHEAGDAMLKAVARSMQKQFGKDHTYRIGGDEFVALNSSETEQSILERIKLIQDETNALGYHVSIGMYRSDNTADPEEIVKEAEKNMYEAKRIYYETKGRDRRSR